jgi:acyl carrier protein
VTRTEILDRIHAIMTDVLDLDELRIDEKTTAADVDGWDSLSHLRIITEIEAAFGVTFPIAEIERFENIGDMVNAIQSKL